MHAANRAKQDEYYTRLEDIEKELSYYRKHFEGKVVFCNCDDPFESNFFKYFAINFNFLKLKKLICTCYVGSPVSHTKLNDLPLFQKNQKLPYKIEITEVSDMNGDGAVDLSDIEALLRSDNNNLTILDEDGDFRSEECIEYLKESDIVVTNPPFSLFREYVSQLMKYGKKFIILGNPNAVTYKEIFPLLKANKMWIGVKPWSEELYFNVPKERERWLVSNKKEGSAYVIRNGQVLGRAPVLWYTNLDIDKRHESLIMYKKYSPDEYPKYDNYDAVNVDKVSDIPEDYEGVLGVPITFLDKYNPDQFDIVGLAPERGRFVLQNKKYENAVQHNSDGSIQSGNKVNDGPVLAFEEKPGKFPYYTADNSDKYLQVLYARILIRRKHEN